MQTELKKKSDIHMTRKIWHAAGVTLMAFTYTMVGHDRAWIVLGILALVAIPFDLFRLKYPMLNAFALKAFGRVMRAHEATNPSGVTYLILGALFLLLFNDRHIVTLSLLFLAFGDPTASFFGIRYGKDKIWNGKSLQGTMGAFAICTITAGLYYYHQNLMTERLIIVAPLSGLIGALAEMLPIGKLDDNLTFPIISGLLLWLLFQLFGGFAV